MKAAIYLSILLGLAAWSCSKEPESLTRKPNPKHLNASQILEMARRNQEFQYHDLSARFVKSKAVIPMGIKMRRGTIYSKLRAPDEIFELKFERKGATLHREVRAGKAPIPDADYNNSFRGTDLTIADLSMRFLNWPNPVRLNDQIFGVNKECWVLRFVNPKRTGLYQTVHIWVDQASAVLLQMEGFGWKPSAKPIKRIKVTQLQEVEVDGNWIVKQMVVESLDPVDGRQLGETKLQVRRPSYAKPAEQGDAKRD